ncbi:hypothetical protein LPJ61_002259 [Coemansia biformis]|uniref:Pentacotripeptide-repeat region of PRORP domain-containing protein n=1 Tax=Coemansia biformis TaxID=1286918 RepID=A0A9W7YEV5_9FUNG|nr:hypothetical protein LPJ61_002259 [Coemansia biformis]
MEPPIATRGGAPYLRAEIDGAIARLQRKLSRFLLYKRTSMKLEAMWALYMEIKATSEWRLGAEELELLLRAILRAGVGTFWCERAQALVADEERRCRQPASAGISMALMRVFAKFGDIRQFDAAAESTAKVHGAEWAAGQRDFVETRAIAFARADLPVAAERILEASQGLKAAPVVSTGEPGTTPKEQKDRQRGPGVVPPPHAIALREVMLAWVRCRDAERAWACLSQLLSIGYGRAVREWNSLLHLHAEDMRYRYPLLEQVLMRMREAGVAYDAATYNIMMHGSLLRGMQPRWKQWYQRMEMDGHKPDVVTYTALFTQLARNGQWGEALMVIQHMRRANIMHTAETAASIMSMDRQRNRSDRVMAQFRRRVLKGGTVPASEFSMVVAAALDAPKKWVSEIALALRCLEDGRVAESAVVDALAAQLPSIGASQIPGRPVLRLLQGDADHVGRVLSASIAEAGEGKSPPASEPGDFMAAGDRRRSFAQTLNVAIRFLIRTKRLEQAEALVRAAGEARVDMGAQHTLISLLHLCARAGKSVPHDMSEKIAATTFAPPSALPVALLVTSIKSGDMAAAKAHFDVLEQGADGLPSTRVFNALMMYAAAVQDTTLLELKWQQMEARGVMPDATSHQTRVFCYSKMDNLLRTRRAYTDMLDYGHPPTFPAISAMVRCCVRAGDLDLALRVVDHAEHMHGTSLNTTTYNYILSRTATLPAYAGMARKMFAAMACTSDARLCSELSDIVRDVEREKLKYVDLRVLDKKHAGLGSWLLRSTEDQASAARVRRALVSWLTSRAAYSAEPTMYASHAKTGSGGDGGRPASQPADAGADAPPPNGTSIIIMMRAYGQRKQWLKVIAVWDAMLAFNRRIDQLAAQHPHVETHRIVPISRMVGWKALALVGLGRPAEARAAWEAAAAEGLMSPAAVSAGMDEMLRRLPTGRLRRHE